MEEESIGTIVRNREQNYINGNVQISKYVNFNMYENIEKIEAYLNSKHTSGETDSMGREKPFFNIVTAAVNIWYRSTNKDRKDIKIKSPNSTSIFLTFLANIHLQEYMRKDAFGVFLNDWGRSLARYGSSMLKFVEAGGKLHATVLSWGNLIVDAVDVDNDVKIEKLFFTPAQLMQKKGYDKAKVKALIEAVKESRKLMGGQQMDNKSEYIPVYEVHGMLPLSTLKEAQGKEENEGDDEIFVQQMHVISYVAKKDKKDEYDEFTLACGREKQDPYMITHLIKEEGRAQAIGAVEHLFEAQWMNNHSVKAIKDQLDLASVLFYQTADTSFVGQNAIDMIANGDILVHAENMPLTQVQNNSHDIVSLQNFGTMWKQLGQEITSTPDALLGKNPPSGTAWRLNAGVTQEAHSLYEIMNQNKELAIEEMCRKFILPYLVTQMDTAEEITATLDEQGIKKIDLMYINAEVVRRNNKHMAEQMFNGQVAQPLDAGAEAAKIQTELNQSGSDRFFKPSDVSDKTWKELFDDFVWDAIVEAGNEQGDKETILATLTTVFQTLVSNPNGLSDEAKFIFNKILMQAGEVSPLEMPESKPTAPPVAQPVPSNVKPSTVQPTT